MSGRSRRRETATGVLISKSEDAVKSLAIARDQGFVFICVGPILNEGYVQRFIKGEAGPGLKEPFSWFDLALSANEWGWSVVGLLTDANRYLEGKDEIIAQRARSLLNREIEFTHHLSLPAVVVELKRNSNNINLAKIVQGFAAAGGLSQQFWMKLPIAFEEWVEEEEWTDLSSNSSDSSWTLWNKFRSLCNFEPKVYPGLELTPDLPSDEEILRWLGEPVRSLFIPLHCFSSNSKGYPVMSTKHQKVVKQFMEMGAQVVIDPGQFDDSTNLSLYHQYVDNLQRNEAIPRYIDDEYDDIQFTSGYEDFLQCPLQPLQDNLESHTYEVFEKDPVKYALYTNAVRDALLDMVPEAEKETKVITLMVVGAGRGPLVRSSISASIEAGRKIKVYAIEKNANAANTLHHLNRVEWKGEVTVINVDMREWDAKEKADILVSELLGSFGDNELSPECLDGAEQFLKPGGVMIPQSYRSYICPVMSSRLYNETRKVRDVIKNIYSNFETPYVVHMKNFYKIDEPQLVFTFAHPKPDGKRTNERYTALNFKAKVDCVLHGFGGYFECTLYGKVIMSILPSSFSKGMFSWFPIFFPIRDPVNVYKNQDITAHFWRCVSRTTVWYEWTMSSPVSVPIHNPNGRSYTIGL